MQLTHNPHATPHCPGERHNKTDSQHAHFVTADNCQMRTVKSALYNDEASLDVHAWQDTTASPRAGFGATATKHDCRVKDALVKNEDVSLSGGIMLPQNGDHRCQALVNKISPLDIAQLGNPHYHGGSKGHNPLTVAIVDYCGYTEINLNDVIFSYNDILHLHTSVLENWEHPQGDSRGPQIDQICERGLPTFPCLAMLDKEATVEFYHTKVLPIIRGRQKNVFWQCPIIVKR